MSGTVEKLSYDQWRSIKDSIRAAYKRRNPYCVDFLEDVEEVLDKAFEGELKNAQA